MKRKLLTLALMGAMLAGPALAAEVTADQLNDPNLAGLRTANGRVVYDFISLWFNEHKPREAFDKYVSRDHYMDHAVYSASTKKPQNFEEEKEAEAKITGTTSKFIFKQMVVQGELVFSHIQVVNNKQPFGSEMVEIERVRDGKIIDHWDIHEPLKEDSEVFLGLDR